jgi:hypothetical protein
MHVCGFRDDDPEQLDGHRAIISDSRPGFSPHYKTLLLNYTQSTVSLVMTQALIREWTRQHLTSS